jgi:hypothetical protein
MQWGMCNLQALSALLDDWYSKGGNKVLLFSNSVQVSGLRRVAAVVWPGLCCAALRDAPGRGSGDADLQQASMRLGSSVA